LCPVKAVRIHEDGGPGVLRHEDAPDPEPAPAYAPSPAHRTAESCPSPNGEGHPSISAARDLREVWPTLLDRIRLCDSPVPKGVGRTAAAHRAHPTPKEQGTPRGRARAGAIIPVPGVQTPP
jgi:hypothetical protein